MLHSLTIGGAEVLADGLARNLRDQFRFVFACLDEVGTLGRQLQEDGFPVHVLQRDSGIDVGCARRLAQVVRMEHVDVIHAHQYTPFFYGVTSRLCLHRTPVLFTEHGRFFPDYPRRKRMVVNRWLTGRRDRFVAVGQAVRQALIDNEGLPAERINVIYNGIPLAAFAAAKQTEDVGAVREELGFGANDFVVVIVARLDQIKDHSTALRAVARAAEQVPEIRLLIVGDGPERTGIESEIQRLEIGRVVRLAGTRRDVPRLLAAADVGLLTSVSEGIPLSLIEGMAAERPVVSTDVGGVSEVVDAEHTGLLVPAGDDQALSDVLVRLAGDSLLRQKLGAAGRRRAESLFSDRQMHERYAELYRDMC
ncbi:MAG: glycosyltransferase [Planctomycetaceae bacterium]|nr:glycosyltransferase [Planctomycetaceae bacterium]